MQPQLSSRSHVLRRLMGLYFILFFFYFLFSAAPCLLFFILRLSSDTSVVHLEHKYAVIREHIRICLCS